MIPQGKDFYRTQDEAHLPGDPPPCPARWDLFILGLFVGALLITPFILDIAEALQ